MDSVFPPGASAPSLRTLRLRVILACGRLHPAAVLKTLGRKHMQTDRNAKSFFFEENPVGYFEDDRLPCSPGCYRYTPYRRTRAPPIARLPENAGPQRCHYITDNTKRYFYSSSLSRPRSPRAS